MTAIARRARGRGRRAVRPAPARGSSAEVGRDDVRLRRAARLPRAARRPPRPRPGLRQGAIRRAPAGGRGRGDRARPARPRCSPGRPGLDRVRGSARRLPFADGDVRRRRSPSRSSSTSRGDRRGPAPRSGGCSGPGGSLAIVDKNAGLAGTPGGPGCRTWRSSGSTSGAGSGCTRPAARSASAGSGPRRSRGRLRPAFRRRPRRAPALARARRAGRCSGACRARGC